MFHLYKITNKINNKKYIGVSVNPDRRFKQHIIDAKNSKYDTYFYNAIRKYGAESFILEILETRELQNDIFLLERLYISKLNTICPNGYNSHLGGKGGLYNPSSLLRKKLSDSAKKRKTHKNLVPFKQGHIPWNKGKFVNISSKFNKSSKKYKKSKLGKSYTLYTLSDKTNNKIIKIIGNYELQKFCKENHISFSSLFKNTEKNWKMNKTKHNPDI